MKKGIAIQTVLLLLIGIIVAGVVIYLVYRYANSKVISEAECNSRLTEICILCKNSGWGPWPSRPSSFFNIIDNCTVYPKFSIFKCGAQCDDCTEINTTSACKIFGIT